MAADTSAPRTRPIVITALLGVVILVSLKFVFDSYYVQMFEEEEYLKVGSVAPTALLELHKAEEKSFAAAPIPLPKAMELVARGRASATITPEQSTDTASLVGWAQLPKTGLGSLPPLPPPAPSAAPSASASAGSATDAGAAAPAGSAAPAPSGKPAVAPVAPGAPHAPPSPSSPSPAPAPHP